MSTPPVQKTFVTMAQAEEVGECLDLFSEASPKWGGAGRDPDQMSLRQLMSMHLEKVGVLRERGFTWEEVAEAFQMAGVELKRDNAQVLFNKLTGRTRRKPRVRRRAKGARSAQSALPDQRPPILRPAPPQPPSNSPRRRPLGLPRRPCP